MASTPAIARRALLAVAAEGGASAPPPLTFGAALALDELDARLAGTPMLRLCATAYVAATGDWRMAGRDLDAVLAWAEAQPAGSLAAESVQARVADLWQAACEPAADLSPPRYDSDDRTLEVVVPSVDGNGLGWVLTLVEWLAAEYGWALPVILDLPIATGLALFTAGRIREGYEWNGPSYAAQERIDAETDGVGETVSGGPVAPATSASTSSDPTMTPTPPGAPANSATAAPVP